MAGRAPFHGILAVLAAAAAASCGRTEQKAPAAPVEAPLAVTVARVGAGPIAATLEVTGTVAPLELAKVGPRGTGRVAAAKVTEGDAVSKQQVLFLLDRKEAEIASAQADAALAAARARLALVETGARPEEISQAVERLTQARADLDLAEQQLARTRTLLDKGAFSAQALEAAEARAKAARAQHEIASKGLDLVRQGARAEERDLARAQLRQAEAGVAAAREMLENTEIRSPLAGVLLKKLSSPGEVVTAMPPTVMGVVADLSSVKIEAPVPETRLPELRAGLPAAVRVDGIPGREFAGEVTLVSPLVDAASRSAQIEVRVPNPDRALRAGMFARVAVRTAERPSALLVPVAAVVDDTVAVAEGNAARLRKVRTGIRTESAVEILEGLAAGDLVVVSGNYGLRDGARIAYQAP